MCLEQIVTWHLRLAGEMLIVKEGLAQKQWGMEGMGGLSASRQSKWQIDRRNAMIAGIGVEQQA